MDLTKEKIKELHQDNPDLRTVLEEKFPEIFIDRTAFVRKGSMFLRSTFNDNIYSVGYHSCRFFIRNIRNDITWEHTMKASNDSHLDSHPYLNKTDFNKLLNKAGTNINKITILKSKDIMEIHKNYTEN
jgi:hypothetical protein